MRLVAATGNSGKLAELAALLEQFDLVAQSELGVPEAVESGQSFVENAIIKARNAAAHTGLVAVADDSGLEVDALTGAPGIYSSRYAGPNASDGDNNSKLLESLTDVPERSARFRCIAVAMRNATDPCPLICVGTWEGRVALEPAGSNGFGYDPLFIPEGMTRTAAQLQPEQKNQLSHRAQALAKLATMLPVFVGQR